MRIGSIHSGFRKARNVLHDMGSLLESAGENSIWHNTRTYINIARERGLDNAHSYSQVGEEEGFDEANERLAEQVAYETAVHNIETSMPESKILEETRSNHQQLQQQVQNMSAQLININKGPGFPLNIISKATKLASVTALSAVLWYNATSDDPMASFEEDMENLYNQHPQAEVIVQSVRAFVRDGGRTAEQTIQKLKTEFDHPQPLPGNTESGPSDPYVTPPLDQTNDLEGKGHTSWAPHDVVN